MNIASAGQDARQTEARPAQEYIEIRVVVCRVQPDQLRRRKPSATERLEARWNIGHDDAADGQIVAEEIVDDISGHFPMRLAQVYMD